MTVLEAIQRSTEFLARKGVDSPRLQAELLLAHVLQLPRLKVYLNFERVLSPAEEAQSRELVRRRGQREPLQHLVGSTSFCGLELTVNRHVLVPRPETECLAERAWQFLQRRTETPAAALDFGTGSGCLAIALAVKCPAAEVTALDLSPEALAVARANADRHGVAPRVTFRAGDGFAALAGGERFALIVSNPPYIPAAEIAGLDPEVRDFDPRLALDGGPDGLAFYRRLAAEAPAWLLPGGCLMAEFGDDQGPAVDALLTAAGWRVEARERDLDGRERFVIASRVGA